MEDLLNSDDGANPARAAPLPLPLLLLLLRAWCSVAVAPLPPPFLSTSGLALNIRGPTRPSRVLAEERSSGRRLGPEKELMLEEEDSSVGGAAAPAAAARQVLLLLVAVAAATWAPTLPLAAITLPLLDSRPRLTLKASAVVATVDAARTDNARLIFSPATCS